MSTDNHDERKLDETLEETFPASDAPANTVETGIGGVTPEAPSSRVIDNRARNRFELETDGEVAFLEYERKPEALLLVHTEVPPALRGRRIGEELVEAGLTAARSAGLTIIAVCPFVKAYMRRQSRLR